MSGVENPADVFTKYVDAITMKKHCWKLGYEVKEDRAKTAPTLNAMLAMLGYQEANDPKDNYITNVDYDDGMKDRMEDSRRGQGQLDRWNQDGLWVVRDHVRSRSELFTPLRVSGSPPAKALTPSRITVGEFCDGEAFRVVDCWTSRAFAHRNLGRSWTGKTFFLLRNGDEAV